VTDKPINVSPEPELGNSFCWRKIATISLRSKAIHYLMVASGAGFAGCLAAIKDYALVPQLKGIGLIICLFGFGFLMASNAYILSYYTRQRVTNRLLFGADEAKPERKYYSEMFTVVFLVASVGALSAAVSIILTKVGNLQNRGRW
jgi:hypothetical protein